MPFRSAAGCGGKSWDARAGERSPGTAIGLAKLVHALPKLPRAIDLTRSIHGIETLWYLACEGGRIAGGGFTQVLERVDC